jgi:hypothetical protein
MKNNELLGIVNRVSRLGEMVSNSTQVSDGHPTHLVGAATGRHPKPRMRWSSQWAAWFWMTHGGGRVDQTPLEECFECGTLSPMGRGRNRCRGCSRARYERRRKIASVAHAKVLAAVKRGILLPVFTLKCADCGAPANQYDHRSYAKPLEVEPVCTRCNKKRGPAIEIRALMERGL